MLANTKILQTDSAHEFAEVRGIHTQLGRNCSFYDIETNVIGLLAGVAVGLVVRLVWTVMAGLVRMVKR